ncbi:MAG: hypothetical protein ABF533_06355 [Acetobacter persici]|uniref:hypothetical protein n=1 Tax=Acetobacter persici TaxID=1076596 RepID=UPI0039EAB0F6
MKKGSLLGIAAGALLVILGLFGILSRHTHSASSDPAQPDPCESSPDKRPDTCSSHGHSSGTTAYTSSNWMNRRASGHESGEAEAESAGHAGFGEGAAGHAGGGGE